MNARRIVANITVTLDGRITGPGGNADMMWVVPHAFADEIRDHMVSMTSTATTALMGSVNAEGFFAVWPMIGGVRHPMIEVEPSPAGSPPRGRRLWQEDLPRSSWSLASTAVAAAGAVRLTYQRVRG